MPCQAPCACLMVTEGFDDPRHSYPMGDRSSLGTLIMKSTPPYTASCLLLVAALVACTGCRGSSSPTAPEIPATPVSLSLSMETAHFLLQYTAQNTDKMDAYAAALEANHPRITRDLGQPNLARITGRFYPDQASYTAATGWDATGSVDGPTMFSVVASPLQPSVPVHEFVHNVALHLNPTAHHTVWLWEATAVYEAEGFVHPATVPCLASGGDFPTLAQVSTRTGDCHIYLVGYTIVELIVERWGFAELRALIRSHGNTQSVLGLSTEEFEAAWQAFVEQRYL